LFEWKDPFVTVAEIVQKIQYMIAPAVMVSSSALLLLGFNNKFSNLANRFLSRTRTRKGFARLGIHKGAFIPKNIL